MKRSFHCQVSPIRREFLHLLKEAWGSLPCHKDIYHPISHVEKGGLQYADVQMLVAESIHKALFLVDNDSKLIFPTLKGNDFLILVHFCYLSYFTILTSLSICGSATVGITDTAQ